MKPGQIGAMLALGFLLGGFAHLWFVSAIGYNALIAAGQSGFGWNVTSVGENINQNIITGDCHHAAAEESFAASTIAIALPAMRAFTADRQHALLLTLLTWGVAHRLSQQCAPLSTVA